MDSGDWKGFVQVVMNQEVEVVKYYLSQPMDVNFLHPEMMTTGLIEAVRTGNLEIVKLLMKKGADPKLASQVGESPVKMAKQSGNKELVRILKDKY